MLLFANSHERVFFVFCRYDFQTMVQSIPSKLDLDVLLSVLGPGPTLPPPSAPAPRPSSGLSFPVLPTVPTDLPSLPDSVPGGNSAGGEDVDFDDLTRRFEDLKKKK